jgi:hypothetical protein
MRIHAIDSFEEQPIARHRVIHTRAREYQPLLQPNVEIMIASAMMTCRLAKHRLHHRRRDAILRRILNSRERQGHDVSEIREQVNVTTMPQPSNNARGKFFPDRALHPP